MPLRAWIARLGLVLLSPLLVLGTAELSLRMLGVGWDPSYLVRSDDGHLLSNPRFGWRFYGRALSRPPIPAAVSPSTSVDTFRIVVLGGSAAEGVPDPSFSFARMLEAMLRETLPDLSVEVLNTGLTAANSHVVRAVARDCRVIAPDLFVIYLGHNEVAGPYGAAGVIRSWTPSLPIVRSSLFVRSTRIGQLVEGWLPGRGHEVSEWRGMEMFASHRVVAEDPRLDTVHRNLEANLRDIIASARATGGQTVLCTPLSNLLDCPPFASLGTPGRSDQDRDAGRALARFADQHAASSDHAAAVGEYRAALELDPESAEIHYRLGRSLAALGRWPEARHSLEAARDLDTLRFRADSRIIDTIRHVARVESTAGDVRLVDLDRMLEELEGPTSIPGSELLFEHVHLTFEGNYLVASALVEAVLRGRVDTNGRTTTPSFSVPGPERVRDLLAYSDHDRLVALEAMSRLTGHAPFPDEWRGRFDDEIETMGARITGDSLMRNMVRLRKRVARRPDDLLLRHRLATALLASGDRDAAAREYHRVLERYPLSSDWRGEYGLVLNALGRSEEAADQFRLALHHRPADVSLLVGLGDALRQSGQPDHALSAYREALRIRDQQATAHLGAGLILMHRGQPVAAEHHFRSAASHLPDAPLPQLFLADSLSRQGRHVEAEAAAARALQLAEEIGAERLAAQIRSRGLSLENPPPATTR